MSDQTSQTPACGHPQWEPGCVPCQTRHLSLSRIEKPPTVTWVPVSQDDATSIIGEGVHTGLRKGTDAPGSPELWDAIRESPRAWSEALAYFVWGLDQMGMALCKKESD
jgi:hypothetical protein